MKHNPLDEYSRGLDLIFQEMADREASAREQELLAKLKTLGASDADIEATRRTARELARSVGKTEAEAYVWADELLRRCVDLKLLNEKLQLKHESPD